MTSTTMIWVTLILCLGFTASFAAVTEDEEVSCSDGWVKLHRGCYRFVVQETKNWKDAAQYCAEAKGQLTSIQSTKEKAAVESYLKLNHPREQKWWGGFQREGSSGTAWKWIADGGAVDGNIMAWRSRSMAKRRGVVCGEIYFKGGVKLSNNKCSRTQPFICEFHSIIHRSQVPTTPVAETTTTTTVQTSPAMLTTTTAMGEQTMAKEKVQGVELSVVEEEETGAREEEQQSKLTTTSAYGAPGESSSLTEADAIRVGLQVASQCNGFGNTAEDADLYRRYLQSELKANAAKVRYYSEVSRLYADALESQKRYYATLQQKLQIEMN